MRRFTSRRGLSTVVTTALMLTAVAILGSTIVAWSNNNLKLYEIALDSTASSNTNKINEFLTIENIWFCKTTCPVSGAPAVNVTLTNGGNIGLNVIDMKLVNTTKTLDVPLNVLIKQGTSYSWQKKYQSNSNIPITIYVTTARGTIISTQVVHP
ncbi:MAG: hypothetical protein ACREAD_05540 [Nitrosopumilaceae archaeon]